MQEQNTRATQILLPGQQLPAIVEVALPPARPNDYQLEQKPVFVWQLKRRMPKFLHRFLTWFVRLQLGADKMDRVDWYILQPGESLSEQRRRK